MVRKQKLQQRKTRCNRNCEKIFFVAKIMTDCNKHGNNSKKKRAEATWSSYLSNHFFHWELQSWSSLHKPPVELTTQAPRGAFYIGSLGAPSHLHLITLTVTTFAELTPTIRVLGVFTPAVTMLGKLAPVVMEPCN